MGRCFLMKEKIQTEGSWVNIGLNERKLVFLSTKVEHLDELSSLWVKFCLAL